jgi:hypothetical protein
MSAHLIEVVAALSTVTTAQLIERSRIWMPDRDTSPVVI